MTKLAIDGGAPVRSSTLPYGRQSIDDADIQAVVETLRSDWLTTGPRIAEFESAFANCVGARHAVCVSSGTAALHAAAFAADLQADDEVIVSPMTFAATANCVRYQGATVRFVDVHAGTLNVDPLLVKESVTSRTKAIIAVDYAGQPCDLKELRAVADADGLILIEDACHALGANYQGRRVGSIADMTVFSLHPVKVMTTGEGGVITTDNADLASRLRLFRNHGITTDHAQREATGSWFYEMVELGYNYRLTDFQAALGASQLSKLANWVDRRRTIARAYNNAFENLPPIELPASLPDRESAWHLYVVKLNLEQLTADRGQVFRALRAEGIGVNVHYVPVPWHPYYERLGYRRGEWPVAERAYDRIISLPIFPAMSDRDIEDVVTAVHKTISSYSR